MEEGLDFWEDGGLQGWQEMRRLFDVGKGVVDM